MFVSFVCRSRMSVQEDGPATFTATSPAATAGSAHSSAQYMLVECVSCKNDEQKECRWPLPQGR